MMDSKANLSVGIAALLLSAMCWGGLFIAGKAILPSLDPFYINALRYIPAALFFVLVLFFCEGHTAFKTDKKGLLIALGALGFVGSSFLSMVGLKYTQPEDAAIIVATQPLLATLLNWGWKGIRPHSFTLSCIVVSFLGILLVVTNGELNELFSNENMFGNAIVFFSSMCWIIYTFGMSNFPTWSPLRYSAMTCLFSLTTIIPLTFLGVYFGFTHIPEWQVINEIRFPLLYLVFCGTIATILLWNIGTKKLGPVNGTLFINFVPITTLSITVMFNHDLEMIKLAGVVLVLLALTSNNLFLRRLPARAG